MTCSELMGFLQGLPPNSQVLMQDPTNETKHWSVEGVEMIPDLRGRTDAVLHPAPPLVRLRHISVPDPL
jgi:hypothetical protein